MNFIINFKNIKNKIVKNKILNIIAKLLISYKNKKKIKKLNIKI